VLLAILLACGTPAHDPAETTADVREPQDAHEKQGHGEHGSAHHRFDDPEKWAKVFDDPERDSWQKPEVVVEAMAIEPGMTVADIGAGTGYFNPHLARAVGDAGRVIAVDIEPALVAYMQERAEKDGTPMVEARLGAPDSPKLEAAEVHRILMVDTHHHIADRERYFRALKSAMKHGGQLIIVDLTKDAPFGPPPEHRLTPEQVVSELTAAGWKQVGGSDGLPHQFLLVFEAVHEPGPAYTAAPAGTPKPEFIRADGHVVVPTPVRAIPPGETLTAADILWTQLPPDYVSDDALVGFDTVVGRTTRAALVPHELIRQERLEPEPRAGALAEDAEVTVSQTLAGTSLPDAQPVMGLVAAADLKPGSTISEDQLAAIEIHPGYLAEGTFVDPSDVAGRVVCADIVKHEFVRAERLGIDGACTPE
jgi:ubiquinone/menaquinone biosynthesis C-methylase UbiE/flagella basal body P-ring formation protein FlgA